MLRGNSIGTAVANMSNTPPMKPRKLKQKVQCGGCDKKYSAKGLENHQINTGHCYCPSCEILFDTKGDLKGHAHVTPGHGLCASCETIILGDQAHHCCLRCKKNFHTSSTKLKVHQRKTGHCYCGDCDQAFPDLLHHQGETGHAGEFGCCDCDHKFPSSYMLKKHLKRKNCCGKKEKKGEKRVQSSATSATCSKCNVEFQSRNALRRHRKFTGHGTETVRKLQCAGTGCVRLFKCPSSMIQHLESGRCASGLKRKQLHEMVAEHDRDRLITTAHVAEEHAANTKADVVHHTLVGASRRLMLNSPHAEKGQDETWLRNPSGSGYSSPSDSEAGGVILTPPSGLTSAIPTPCGVGSIILTPPTSSTDRRISQSIAMASVVEGTIRYHCHVCPSHHRSFQSLQALEMHMDSPVHCAPIFHCPVGLFSKQPSPPLQGGGTLGADIGSILCGSSDTRIAEKIQQGSKEEPSPAPGQPVEETRYFKTLGGLAQHLEHGACRVDGVGKSGILMAARYIESRLMELGVEARLIM
ncbi:hypothetical protein MKZ38_009079 [Zalerion maritima]|uniref:C2H2-type domain-containing protein n=1 Tax=Zalerion maritima TaxID=339359 RepID=A0AAD5RHF9_9PEZI|nr:hypothetical protein MKZ38_009079 [Zalerion maritima]